jgi:hypothetical protein
MSTDNHLSATVERDDRADAPAGRVIPSDPDALLLQIEAAYLAAISPRTLESLRSKGGGPIFVALGRRAIRYRRRDLLAWVEQRMRRTTSDTNPHDCGRK